MQLNSKISPCLWFGDQAEEAAIFYTHIFRNSRILNTTHYSEAGQEIHGRAPGSVMTVEFELDGMTFTALNGGRVFTFSEAISFQVLCDNQAEVDYFWDGLSAGGDKAAQQCGWLKDRFGLSWQVVPKCLPELLKHSDAEKSRRVTLAMFAMKKLDIAALERA